MLANKFSQPLYILDAIRTPVAGALKGLKSFSAAQLAGLVIQGLLERQPFFKEKIDEVILGTTVLAGTGQNLAREAVMLAGLLKTTPGFVINSVCGSGLQSIIMAGQAIISDGLNAIIAGGSESATHCPRLVWDQDVQPLDSLVYDGLRCRISDRHMGELAEALAQKFNISREDQDEFSFLSHRKALSAQAQGKFNNEIIPVQRPDGSVLAQDEKPRKNINLEILAKLPSAFLKDGTVTSGNASAAVDGAAVVLLACEKMVDEKRLKPKARLMGYASVADDPTLCFEAGVKAAHACLGACGLKINDIDLFEITESFAAQAIFTQRQLNISHEKMNIYGGDIALGHPLGATAARSLITLISGLHQEKKKMGLVTTCFGSGGAVSAVIERL